MSTTDDYAMANRLHLADIEIAELTLARTKEDLAACLRRFREAFDHLQDVKANGFGHHLRNVMESARE